MEKHRTRFAVALDGLDADRHEIRLNHCADIKIGSFYDYFSNKEAVISELYEEKLAEVGDFLDAEVICIERAAWRQQTANS